MSSNDIDDEESVLASSSETASSNKQQKASGRPFNPVWNHFNQIEKKQEDLLKYVKNQEIPSKRQKHLENGMCLAFICAGISFNAAKNKIVCAWIQDLKPGFKIPTNSALENEIQINNIVGGGIKRYVATRWSSYYDAICSILHLKVAFVRDNLLPTKIMNHLLMIHLKLIVKHCKHEKISYIDHELTLEDILIVANETGELNSNDSNEDFDKDYVGVSEVGFKSLDEILKLEEAFDFNYEIFRENSKNNNAKLGSEDVVEENPNYDYNIDSLVDEIFT
ncbi:13177_t:CDS:2 [Cetraspora pellucida]|uniref:13177_t:CDS:1 n=1 Tax=Cetraspora pellucida TaxID=1433469 RepID=A0A9N9A9Q2_9GLOM|nr:13177_t:CDS:2 [Cetraspora pellucida]